MISRGSMGKQLTGNRAKKMATGGKASASTSSASKSSASKSSAAKGSSKPAAKTGGSAAGKTVNTSATRAPTGGGGGGLMSGIRNAVGNVFSGNKKMTSVTDPKTGQAYVKPTYSGMSLKGLTSNDPANVARNRAAAAGYAKQAAERMQQRGDGAPTTALPPTTPAAAQPSMGRVYVPPPPGYRPGVDPEHQFYQTKPTIALKKGGRVKPKRVK